MESRILVTIASADGLLPDGTKQLSGVMSIYHW